MCQDTWGHKMKSDSPLPRDLVPPAQSSPFARLLLYSVVCAPVGSLSHGLDFISFRQWLLHHMKREGYLRLQNGEVSCCLLRKHPSVWWLRRTTVCLTRANSGLAIRAGFRQVVVLLVQLS